MATAPLGYKVAAVAVGLLDAEAVARPGAHPYTVSMSSSSDSPTLCSPGRLTAFSDGVLAIAITLLVLELRVPHLVDELSRREAWEALLVLGPKFGSFVLSFAYLAVFWVNHHHFFDLVDEVDPGLLWLNNLLLLFLCFIPFPTAFIGEYPDNPVALAVFALVMMGAGLVFTLMWPYAHRRGLMRRAVTRKAVKSVVRRGMLGPPLYAFAAIAAFVAPWVAWVVFATAPAYFFHHSMHRPRTG
jgi:uncharacterized membrane protein